MFRLYLTSILVAEVVGVVALAIDRRPRAGVSRHPVRHLALLNVERAPEGDAPTFSSARLAARSPGASMPSSLVNTMRIGSKLPTLVSRRGPSKRVLSLHHHTLGCGLSPATVEHGAVERGRMAYTVCNAVGAANSRGPNAAVRRI
jgi:hypothetical protein